MDTFLIFLVIFYIKMIKIYKFYITFKNKNKINKVIINDNLLLKIVAFLQVIIFDVYSNNKNCIN